MSEDADRRLWEVMAEAIPTAPAGTWTPAEAKPLTAEMIRNAIEKMQVMASRICGVTEPHVIHPHHWRDGGWGICGNCMLPVFCEPGGVVTSG